MADYDYTAEVIFRLTKTDAAGVEHVVDVGMNPDVTFHQVWGALHSREDGMIPHPRDIGSDLWSHAHGLADAENELRRKCGVPERAVHTAPWTKK